MLEPVAPERVDAEDVVGVDLGLHATDLEDVHRPRERQARGLDAPARAQRAGVDDPGLQECEALDQVDVEEPDEADRLGVGFQRPDDERDRGRVVQDVGDEVRVIGAEVTAEEEELAAHHLVEQWIAGPGREVLQLVPGGRSQAKPGGAGE